MRFSPAPALVLVALVLAGCGGAAPPARDGTGPTSGTLTVTVIDDVGATPRTWTLTCDPAGGSHPDPAAACRAVDAAPAPFAPKPADTACTQIYGGPQTATITGDRRGRRVDAAYERTDGCEITRWNTLAAVLGAGGN